MVSRPMGLQEAEFDGDLWFFAYADSAKVRQIRVNPEVNVVLLRLPSATPGCRSRARPGRSTTGRKAEELWNPVLKAWFPDGLETPGPHPAQGARRIRRVLGLSVSTVVNLFGYAKAAVTGKPPEVGENHEVSY